MKALIVDPSRVVVTTLSILFDRYGISSISAGCGQDALDLLERERVDLMFAATHDKAAVDRALDTGSLK